jgi:glycosyltransferase involved in cell wall biosynthesis
MRTLYDYSIFQQQQYGGISKYFYELITHLLKYEDLDIDLYMGFFINKYGLERFRAEFSNYFGYQPPLIRRTGFIRRFATKLMWQGFQSRSSRDKHCIYHHTYYDSPKSDVSRNVFTVYDFTHERLNRFFSKNDNTPSLKREAFRMADALICISESTKKDMLELYDIDPSCKIAVIHLACDNISGSPAADIKLPDAPYLLFVGPRGGYKNFIALLDAYAQDASLKKDFAIACLGSEFSQSEQAIFSERGVSERIFRYSGGDDVLAALYKNAHVFVYPSQYEGFGLPLLEAMSCECPVLAGNNSSIPEVAGNAAALFDASSSESLREVLHKLAYDDSMRKSLKAAGKERCKLFSWERCAKETYALYKEIV